jgi:pimeloyl-ACP methyl ester carboxylesterase
MDRSASFARAARRLADLRVVTYDRRGYGRSGADPSDEISFATHVNDLVDVIAGRRVVVVGHSFGGDVALAAALAHPELVGAVGAYEPPLPWLESWPRGGAAMDIKQRGLDDPAEVAERFIRNVAGDAVWEGLPERTKAQRRAEGAAVLADVGALTTGPAPFTVGDLEDLVRSGMPVLLASGSHSKPHQHEGTRQLGATITAPVCVFDDARHGGHSSHPDRFAEWVRQVVAAARHRGDL